MDDETAKLVWGHERNPTREEFTNKEVFDGIDWTSGAYGSVWDRDGWLAYAVHPETGIVRFVALAKTRTGYWRGALYIPGADDYAEEQAAIWQQEEGK